MKTKKSIFKRWWFWVILVVIVAGVALGGSGDEKSSEDGTKTVADGQEKGSAGTGSSDESESGAADGDSQVTVAEQVLVDQDGVKVTATGMSETLSGLALELKIENNSDKAVTVQPRDVAVNGIMFSSASFSSDVAAGKTANTELEFYSSELENAGVATIGTMELKIAVVDGESWEDVFTTEQITVPTSADGTFEQTYDDSGFLAIDQDGYKVIVKKLDSEDSFWGADIYVYVENNSDKDVTIQTRDVSINGVMTEPMFSCEVLAGKKAFDTITFLQSDLDDNKITDITDMELYFTIFDSNSWDTLVDTDIVSVKFEE